MSASTPLVLEPVTSLLQRELTILSKNFGQLQRTCWELGRLLLRARTEYGMTSVNKGKSGTESERRSETPAVSGSASEPPWVQEEIPLDEGSEDGS